MITEYLIDKHISYCLDVELNEMYGLPESEIRKLDDNFFSEWAHVLKEDGYTAAAKDFEEICDVICYRGPFERLSDEEIEEMSRLTAAEENADKIGLVLRV